MPETVETATVQPMTVGPPVLPPLDVTVEANQRINLTVGEELNRVGDRVHDPVDVFLGIEPHVGGHGSNE
jgi:hypothetical protein